MFSPQGIHPQCPVLLRGGDLTGIFAFESAVSLERERSGKCLGHIRGSRRRYGFDHRRETYVRAKVVPSAQNWISQPINRPEVAADADSHIGRQPLLLWIEGG